MRRDEESKISSIARFVVARVVQLGSRRLVAGIRRIDFAAGKGVGA